MKTNTFASYLKRETSYTETQNGAICLSTSGDGLVDLFGTIGALRSANNSRIYELFDRAVAESKELAAKILFYGRDIREGLGERDTFRKLLTYAANTTKEIVIPNIPLIGFYGRFDDLYCLVGTPVENEMWAYMKSQFDMDLENMKNNKPCSLLAKWIKTPNASSKTTKAMGIMTSQKLGYANVGEFKKDLKALRKYLDIVEIKVASENFDTIAYNKVPSNAMMKYRSLFKQKDESRFNQYLEDVKSGKATIKSGTLYPYDFVQKVFHNDYDEVLEEQWKALPNYVDEADNILVVADVSGSMTINGQQPLATSIGLGIYFAERCTGPFHNMFMTFSEKPVMESLHGHNLESKINHMRHADWGYNTNLEAVFNVVLNTALSHNMKSEDMPKAIVIISDMQIDEALGDNTTIFYDAMKAKYAQNGYTLPNVVFWNVNSETDAFHADANYKGVQYLSGHSTNAFKSLLKGLNMTAYEAMMEVITSERYSYVTVAA